MLQYAFCISLDPLALNGREIQGTLTTSQPSQATARACELSSMIFLPMLCACCLKSHLSVGNWGKRGTHDRPSIRRLNFVWSNGCF